MAEESFRRTFRNATRVYVPGDGLCGLHAIRASIQAQAQAHLPVPSVEELLAVLDMDNEDNDRIRTNIRVVDGTRPSNRDWFLQDHLAAIFNLWGQSAGFDVALGIWTKGIGYQLHDTDTTNQNTTIVWVYHNGASHYEGLRDSEQTDNLSLSDQTGQNTENQPESKIPDHEPLFNDKLLHRPAPRPEADVRAPNRDDPGVFLSTQREYPVEFRHLNCSSPPPNHGTASCSWLASVEISEDGKRSLAGCSYNWFTSGAVRNEDSSDPNSRWMAACLGTCNEYEYQNDQLDTNIATGLQGRAQAFYELAHPHEAKDVEITGTRVVWLENSVPTYFSTRHKTQQPHSGAITAEHLALIQARSNIDKIQLDFVSYDRKPEKITEKSSQRTAKILNNVLRKCGHGSKISKIRTSGLRRMSGARTCTLGIVVAIFLRILRTKRIDDLGLGDLIRYNTVIVR